MKSENLFQNPALKKLIREWSKGDVLFLQGDTANTVLLVLEGSLELTQKKQNKTLALGRISAGEFIGEKALLNSKSFKRQATATALEATKVLELGPEEFSQIEKDATTLYCLLLRKAFKMMETRLEQSEHLIETLKSFDPRHRFVHYLQFLTKFKSEVLNGGKQIIFDPEVVAFQINCPSEEIQTWLSNLCEMKVVKKGNAISLLILAEERIESFDPESLEELSIAA